MTDKAHKSQTKVSDLLARFAAVSQRLEGTGAPGMPGYIDLEGNRIHDWEDPAAFVVINPQACLAACVMWAMEALSHFRNKDSRFAGGLVAAVHTDLNGRFLWSCTVFGQPFDRDKLGTEETPAEAWCRVLESIADAIGGG